MILEVKIHEPPQRTVKFCLIKDGEFFLLPCGVQGDCLCQRIRIGPGMQSTTMVVDIKDGREITGVGPMAQVIPLAGVKIEAFIDFAKRPEGRSQVGISKQMVLG